jgi:hypothetical protein
MSPPRAVPTRLRTAMTPPLAFLPLSRRSLPVTRADLPLSRTA